MEKINIECRCDIILHFLWESFLILERLRVLHYHPVRCMPLTLQSFTDDLIGIKSGFVFIPRIDMELRLVLG